MKKIMFINVIATLGAFAVQVPVTSPDGLNEIVLDTEPVLNYSIKRSGKQLVAPTPIGIKIDSKTYGGAGVKIKSQRAEAKSGLLATSIYKKSRVNLAANEVEVTFEDGWAVVLNARNDGVAYRIKTMLPGTVKVQDETAGILFPNGDVTVYGNFEHGAYNGDKLQNSWETVTQKLTAGKLPSAKEHLFYLPLLAKYDDGTCLVMSESDLRDYPGLNLEHKDGDKNGLSSIIAKYPDSKSIVNNQRQRRIQKRYDYIAETEGTRVFPWRVFMLAPCAAKLVECDTVYALASDNCLSDTSWIKLGKVAWDWWNDWNVSGNGIDFKSGCNTETYRYYIDFAAKHKVEYVIFDEGWSKELRIMEINPAVDVPALVQYANEKGVGIILWCSWPQLMGRQHEVFKRYSDMGVKGFKIDFMDRDDQFVVKYLEETARIAADYKLLVDYHGMFKPTGLHRTYPNIINYEGVYGLEQMKWTSFDNMPGNDLTTVFVRMSAGPLDYTPGAMRNQTRKGFKANWSLPTSQGTRVHQMALMTIFEAPLQMLCDSPTQYLQNKECFKFMASVPTVWDDTKGLLGDIDKVAAVARRKGSDWFVGVIGSWDEQDVTLPTDFLAEGEWKVELFADGINANRDATDYKSVGILIKAGDEIKIHLASGGGWTARFTPASWYNKYL